MLDITHDYYFNEVMDPTLPEENKSPSFVIPLLAVFFGVALGGGYLYLKTTYPNLFRDTFDKITTVIPGYNRQAATSTNELQKSSPLPTRSPYPLVPDDGTAGTFKISQGSHSGPTFTDLRIDPLDAKVGDKVTITLGITSTTPTSSLSGALFTDTGKIDLPFQKISRKNDTEKWVASFELTQPVLYTYKLNFLANDGTNTSNMTMAPRN